MSAAAVGDKRGAGTEDGIPEAKRSKSGAEGGPPPLPESADLPDVVAADWKARLYHWPEFATSIGIHDYDDRLDDVSIGAHEARLGWWRSLLAVMDSQPEPESLGWRLTRADIATYLDGAAHDAHLMLVSNIEGPHIDFPRLLGLMKTETAADFGKILSRLRAFPGQVDDTIAVLQAGCAGA